MTINDYDEHEFDNDDTTPTTSATDLPPILDPKAPSVSAHEFLARRNTRLIFWRKEFYTWVERHYEVRSKDEMNAEVRRFLDGGMTEALGQFHANIQKISEVIDAIKAAVMVPDRYEAGTNLRTGLTRSLIPCRNGMLDIRTRVLIAHSDEWLVLNSLPFDYDSTPAHPVEWIKFLHSLWPSDLDGSDGSITTLQEMLGYIVSGRTDQQKMFLLKGPTRSGKGTLAKIAEMLVGTDNYVGIPLCNLSEDDFGLAGLLNKTLMVVPDSRDTYGINIGRVTEQFLSISGEDVISVRRKFLGAWIGMLQTRIIILSNALPRFLDLTGVIAKRFVPFKLTESFYGREDHGLLDKLRAELPAIFNWALDGLERLIERGRFIIPLSAQELVDDMAEEAAPHLMFIRECLVPDGDAFLEKSHLYSKYKTWCFENGHKVCAENRFTQLIISADIPGAKHVRPHKQPRRWEGIRFRGTDDDYDPPQGAQEVKAKLDAIFI